MKIIILIILLSISIFTHGQGIRFENNSNWNVVLQKAKQEHKYIFVDIMATWCMPCKLMELNVYPDKVLGDFANEHFISVKMQGDKTSSDSPEVKSWYNDSESLIKKYKINAYPTYLFFNSEGCIVHMSQGAMDVGNFKDLLALAIDDKRSAYGQYARLLAEYLKGKKDYKVLPNLMQTAKKVGERKMADQIGLDYIHNHLLKLNSNEVYTAENLKFIKPFVSLKEPKLLAIFYPNGKKADQVVSGISNQVLNQVIIKDEVEPKILKNGNYQTPRIKKPNWDVLRHSIAKKYRIDPDTIINIVKQSFFAGQKDWNACGQAKIEYYSKFKPISRLNSRTTLLTTVNVIWDLATKVTDPEILLAASSIQLEIMDRYRILTGKKIPLTVEAALLDTYACLLYKAGKIEDAIRHQKDAVVKDPTDELKGHLAQMIQGGILNLKSPN